MNKQIKRNIFVYNKYFVISIFCALLILLLKTTSQTISAKDNFHIYNDKLISIYSAYQENLLKTRTPLKIKKDNDSIVVINNCVEYIEQLKYFPECKSIINKRINSEYQTCLQLAALKHSISPKQSLWKQDSLTSFIYKYLDLSTFRSSLRPRWGEKGSFYLENFGFDSVNIEPYTTTINTKDWLYIFDILAEGDINHDGYEDLLISFLDDSKKGTYFSFSTFLLIFKDENDRIIIAMKIEDILKYLNLNPIDFNGTLYKPIFYDVYAPNDIDISIVPKEIKERFQTFLNRYHKYELKSYNEKNVDFPKTFQLKKKQHLKRIIISLINIEGIDTFANSFIEKAPISYEWEGMSDGPLKEAKYAEEFLLKYPQTPMTDFLYLFLLHRIKCGYECLLFEKKEEEYKKYIEKYTTYLQKIMSISDDLIKLIACDIDKQKYIYLPPQKLIKDKKE